MRIARLTATFSILALLAPVPATAAAVAAADRDDWASALHRALDVAAGERWEEAETTIAATDHDQLIAFVRWKRLVAGDPELEISDYVDYLRAAADWPGRATIHENVEQRLVEEATVRERIAFFEQYKPQTAQGRLSFVEALAAQGRGDDARDLIRHIWREDNLPAVDQRRFLTRFGDFLAEDDHHRRLDRLLWQGRHRDAMRLFGVVNEDRKRLAEARIMLRRQERGVDRAIARVPAHLDDDAGLAFERARWRRLKGKLADARALLSSDFDPGTGRHLFWRERRWHIHDRLDAQDFANAYRLAASHQQIEGLPFAEAEWMAGWLALRFLDRPEAAAGHFEALYGNVRSPISLSRGAYWRGRAASALDGQAEAREWFERAAAFPTTFYGQQALVELERPLKLPEPLPWSGEPSPEASSTALDVAALLCELGAADQAGRFARHHLANHPAPEQAVKALAHAADRCARPDLLAETVRRLASSGELSYLASFPTPAFAPFLNRNDGVPPALALAIARQESLFKSTARSRSGALGLMQVMPATGAAVARGRGETIDGERLSADPTFNVRIGRDYLESLLESFNGNIALTAAGYNAGPTRVRRWLRELGPFAGNDPHDWLDWLEQIPFNETRNYVQRVMEGVAVYEALLERYPEGNFSWSADRGPIWPTPRPQPRPGNLA